MEKGKHKSEWKRKKKTLEAASSGINKLSLEHSHEHLVPVIFKDEPINGSMIANTETYFEQGSQFHYKMILSNAKLNNCGEYVCKSEYYNISTKVKFYPNHFPNKDIEIIAEDHVIQVYAEEEIRTKVTIMNYYNRINCFTNDFYWMKGNG